MVLLTRNLGNHGVHIRPPKPNNHEFVTVDLHVGASYQEPGDSNLLSLPETYLLKPNSCILVTTEESLELPGHVFAVLCSKGSLTTRGLMVPNTKVDPNFSGQLNISIFNASEKPVQIKKGMPFCAVFFHVLEHRVPSAIPRHAPLMIVRKRSWIVDFWQTNRPYIITAVISVLGSVAATLAALSFDRAQRKAEAKPQPPTPALNQPAK